MFVESKHLARHLSSVVESHAHSIVDQILLEGGQYNRKFYVNVVVLTIFPLLADIAVELRTSATSPSSRGVRGICNYAQRMAIKRGR